jgi:NAD(P) transhydrogenase subunit alpha
MPRLYVPQETRPSERRVATVPATVKKLVELGFEVGVQSGAGLAAGFPDEAYQAAGARLVAAGSAGAAAFRSADVVFKVLEPLVTEVDQLRSGALLFALLDPFRNLPLVRRLAERGISSFAMELVPQIPRGQAMDAHASQASISGYKAVLIGAARLGKLFPQMMTAAGHVQPARVVILGAGFAGLQALATARRLGGTVEVSDVRPERREQVESLGGRFIDLPGADSAPGGETRAVSAELSARRQERLTERLAQADLVIGAAQVPGQQAPLLLTRAMVEAMKPGAVIVDLAAATGGNCELTRVDEEVAHHGVVVLGPGNLPATVPGDASRFYAQNLYHLLALCWRETQLRVDESDEVIAGALLTHGGEIRNRAIAAFLTDTAVRA